MEQYIDKSALVAEIERLREEEYPCDTFEESTGYYNALDEVSSFLNTLEVKEVDLEKEIKNAINEYYNECEKKLQEMNDNDTDISFLQLDKFAKHFFKLGLNAQMKTSLREKDDGKNT